jgi:endoglucanase
MNFKHFFILTISTLLISMTGVSQNTLPWISVKGKNFVNEKNEIIVLHGLDASDPDKLEKEGQWNNRYFAEMKKWNANIVRFAIHPDAWRRRGEAAYLKLIDDGIKLAADNGLYVILDWHSIGNLRTEMFFKEGYNTSKKETFTFWGKMAERYGKNSTVAFFELFNEPTTMEGRLGICSWDEWKLLNEEMIGIIRAYGAKNIPLVAGFNWGYDLTPVKNNPIKAEGVAYVSHPYPQKREKPWAEKWEQDFGFVANIYPIVLTEVGFCWPEDKGAHIPVMSDESYVSELLSYCTSKGISYTVWVFDPVWSPMLIKDWTFEPTRAGKVWKDAMTKK